MRFCIKSKQQHKNYIYKCIRSIPRLYLGAYLVLYTSEQSVLSYSGIVSLLSFYLKDIRSEGH